MKTIKKIFGLDRLYARKVGLAYFIDIFLVYSVIFAVSVIARGPYVYSSEGAFNWFSLALLTLATLYFLQELLQTIFISLILKSRSYTLNLHPHHKSQFAYSCANDELDIADDIQYIETTDNYKLFDARFNFFRKTKHGRYKSGDAFYTVIEFKLHRNVPHLLFDSKKPKGRQFKLLFIASQKLEFESDFNQYFDVYSPKFYQIDTLSFITPEVMQALVELSDYDIEIKNDSLICLAPLLKNDELEDFKSKASMLHEKLNDNLDTYRDERMDYSLGNKYVTDFGGSLLLSTKRFMPVLALSGAAVSALLYMGITISWEVLSNRLSILAILIFISTLYKIIRQLVRNHNIEVSFRNMYKKEA